jgi:hypothetical protein
MLNKIHFKISYDMMLEYIQLKTKWASPSLGGTVPLGMSHLDFLGFIKL